MNVSCSRSELREALRVVGGVVDPNNIKPILKDVNIRVQDGQLEISATDLEVGIKYFVSDVEVKDTGGIVVPVDPVSGIVSESREQRLTLYVKDNHLIVEGEGSKFDVLGLPEEEFPEIPGFPNEASLEIEGAILREMISKTIFAVGVEKQRYALNGALLVATKDSPRLVMVGSDGRRLAVIKRKANENSPFTSKAIIPIKALRQVEKMIGEEEIVKIHLEERRILLKTEKGVMAAQLVEGRFPPYEDVVPDNCDKKMQVQRDELGNAIRRAAILAAKETRAVSMEIKDNELVTRSSDPEAGDARVQLRVNYEGAPLNIKFNPDYILDGIKAMDDETIRFEFKDASRAAVMRGGVDYLYLIMPITQD